ncbi:unnamed protein product [Darwinula stevensoni]|uniref:Beta-galactosidase n=1 Tax=Darwinula stevensoni TaxID=69355 RepID=A0A7R8XD16_9CRUS|nr:unnamed protein product [Darwinula stevensoni]CAG0892806.1 unnamed protein product [Darwinula stevensoni]
MLQFRGIALLLGIALYLGGKVESGELYDYYSSGGIESGLEEDGTDFALNGKYIQLVSGSLHYFRIHPEHWRSSLRKMRACGLNAVTTYIPWNLHEPREDEFVVSGFVDFREFLRVAEEEDLFVIVRPGPYICSEWEFGGLPSYLLRDPDMVVRTSNPQYLERVRKYFEFLIPILAEYQWSPGNPRPIIAAQVENEYGVFPEADAEPDTAYLVYVRDLMVEMGLDRVLFFTSDTPTEFEDRGAIPGVLMTANFRGAAEQELRKLQELQPGKPSWVMELWVGWFDHWMGGFHHTVPIQTVLGDIETVFHGFNGSVNMYMFQGGSTRGFMSGANSLDFFPNYWPQSSSYDYDAPLTEAGDYTEKYDAVCAYIQENAMGPDLPLPLRPPENLKVQYPVVVLQGYLGLQDFIDRGLPMTESETLLSMEHLNANGGSGQSVGFVVYRKRNLRAANGVLTFGERGKDLSLVLMDGIPQTLPLSSIVDTYNTGQGGDVVIEGDPNVPDGEHRLDVVVENTGRINYGKVGDFMGSRKGIFEAPLLWDGTEISDWSIYSLELLPDWLTRSVPSIGPSLERPPDRFMRSVDRAASNDGTGGGKSLDLVGQLSFQCLPVAQHSVEGLEGWGPERCATGPCLARGTLEVTGEPMDTWIHLFQQSEHWVKGNVIVNGLNLGRFWDLGPTQTLYVPGPLLRTGSNEIFVFDLYDIGTEVNFSAQPILEQTKRR